MEVVQIKNNSIWKAHLALFLVNMLYGASHVIAKGVMPNFVTPAVFILMRVVGAVFLFWLILSFSKVKKPDKKDVLRFVFCGFFGVALNQLCFFHGLNFSSPINSGIIMAMNPIFVVFLSFLFLKESLTFYRVLGVVLGALGACLLTLDGVSLKSDAFFGDVLLLVNCTSYAFYLVLAKPLMRKYSPLTVITYVFSIGLFFVLLYPPTLMEFSKTNFSLIPSEAWIKIMYVVVGVTFLTYLLTLFGLKHLSASTSSAYIYTQPVMVILFTYLFAYIGFSEDYTNSITPIKIAYMFLIFFGVYLTGKKE